MKIINFTIIKKVITMIIQEQLITAENWSKLSIDNLKKIVIDFGKIDTNLRSDFSSDAKCAYVELLILLDDKIKFLTDLHQTVDCICKNGKLYDAQSKSRINCIVENSVSDIEESINVCKDILDSPPELLQQELCRGCSKLVSTQQTFQNNRENLHFFILA